MLIHVNIFLMCIILVMFILSIERENIIYSVINIFLSGIGMLFWNKWELMAQDGTFVSYSVPNGTWGIPLLFVFAQFLVLIYLTLQRLRTGTEELNF